MGSEGSSGMRESGFTELLPKESSSNSVPETFVEGREALVDVYCKFRMMFSTTSIVALAEVNDNKRAVF